MTRIPTPRFVRPPRPRCPALRWSFPPAAWLALAALLHAAPAAADDIIHGTPHVTTADPSEGTGVGSLSLDVATLDPTHADPTHHVAVGFQLQIVGRRTAWPVMIGLGGGILSFDGTREKGPTVSYVQGGALRTSATDITRTVEVRHAELVFRYEPFWGRIRPFAEAVLGMGVLWHGASLRSADGQTIRSADEQRSVSVLFGGSIGLEWRFTSPMPDRWGTQDLLLSIGVKRLYTGPMERPGYVADENAGARATSPRAPLALWVPFIAISFAGDTRPEARARPSEPPALPLR